jgi:hypothetical protein
MSVEHWIDLRCHASTRTEMVHAIRVLVRRSPNAELQMTFRLDGDLSQIRIPSPGIPRIGKELWRHTCFEAFISMEDTSAYHEFNFAPSGEWCIYALSGYRNGAPLADETMRPQIMTRTTDTQFELDAIIDLDTLSARHSRAVLRIGLSAVVEADDGLSYWALHHPAERPDFHDRDGFALLLEPRKSQ